MFFFMQCFFWPPFIKPTLGSAKLKVVLHIAAASVLYFVSLLTRINALLAQPVSLWMWHILSILLQFCP